MFNRILFRSEREERHTDPSRNHEVKRGMGLHFWSRGYGVSTVGLDEETIRKSIRDQETLEKQQLDLDLE
jgi:REP element-mobilizing transposase RayT